ncbi:4-(cytidine 5'-diphospho)-2-C-methyl-D-erythritol kinase [Helicobacter cappadocius]|uniref:4-diphosphocytidyl-2-C-methyl-D-erythritol kinase n=1 Tax=Helicobacter cappadocius TaxID=3063998 RepID=A0AA90PLW0_9HELI|nr:MULTISPECIES: 4-(cytidine 5'-diphospho)-2-C-methyl-D-erythritol kinase [unclassified Helicobacter]MDO7253631.1 4-(cytidine 5'-diphospho)-2-C-methyl-D-erythritol kinase [Helicobacter sp. faydin-H75]MDP2539559.1 4-(cytidine 5'-diphospho)-2-C-methyl-D-erythritol kinase [Helicobacter sp. faydin-H76]
MIFDVFPKINIFLKIIGFQGAYHTISSRFVLAIGNLKDIIEIKSSKNFSLKGDFGCKMEENLIYRSIIELKNYLEFKNIKSSALECLHIEVEKKIPKGAGLGGGSADAGICLIKINELFDFGLTQKELQYIGSKIGSDVSFFTSKYKSANVSGIGEIIEEFREDEHTFEIFTPDIFCDTKKVYLEYDKNIQNQKPDLLKTLQHNCTEKILSLYERKELNDLLIPAINTYPELDEIQKDLGKQWHFSGSGSSFFRLKDKK